MHKILMCILKRILREIKNYKAYALYFRKVYNIIENKYFYNFLILLKFSVN